MYLVFMTHHLNDLEAPVGGPWCTDFSAEVTLPSVRPEEVIHVLSRAQSWPDWNPALTSIEVLDPRVLATTGSRYPIVVRGVFRGSLTYLESTPSKLVIDLDIPGLHERGTWSVDANEVGVNVVHTVQQRGPLTKAIGRHEAQRVPWKRLWRLERLFEPSTATFR